MGVFRQYDPIPAFTFHLRVAGIEVAYFTECAGLILEREVKEFREGGTNDFVYQFPGPVKEGRIRLRRGSTSPALWKWFLTGYQDGRVKRRNVSIVVRDRKGDQVREWHLANAWPVKYEGPQLKADQVQPALELLEIIHGGQAGGGGGPSGGGGAAGAAAEEEEEETEQAVDVQALADKVYAQIKQELRLERERLG